VSDTWVAIGEVGIDSGSFVVADPAMARPFAEDWLEDVESDEPELLAGNFEELSYTTDESTARTTVVLVNTRCDGNYVVEAQFCDFLDNESLEVCAVRIRLHDHDDDDREQEAGR
jgi:hypothetical protein